MIDWQRICELRRKAKNSNKFGQWLRPGKFGITSCEVITNYKLDWQSYNQIADTFKVKAKYQDREDLKADIITRLADIANRNGNPLSKPSMLRIGSYVVMEYWHSLKRNSNMTSLNVNIEDGEGHETELYQTLADDKAIDLDNWLDCKTWLRGCPKRLVAIAAKNVSGNPLNGNDQRYLNRYQEKELKKAQKALF